MQALTLACGPWLAEVVPDRGARMTRLTFGNLDVLEPIIDWTAPGRAWPAAGLYPLVPFSNRIEHGLLHASDREVQLKVHPFAAPHVVHGPGHRRAWTVAERHPGDLHLQLDYPADEDWPWPFVASLTYALRADSVLCRIELTNRSDAPMPAGVGLHPFFHAPTDTRYRLAHRDVWPQSDLDPPLPHFSEQAKLVEGTVTEQGLISCLGRWDGAAVIERADLAVMIEASPNLSHLVVYRAAGSAFLCLEPVSHATNAFNHHRAGHSHSGATFLGSGDSLTGTMIIRCRSAGASTPNRRQAPSES